MRDNPYASPVPTDAPLADDGRWSAMKVLGTVGAIAGLCALVYGAVACFVVSLPPNNPVSGRLPSIYIMVAGGIFAVIGFAMRDLRSAASSRASSKGVSSAVGILILAAIVVGLFVWIARL